MCSMKSTRIVARVLSQSEPPVSSHVVEQGHELFVALGMSNPEFQWEILEDLFEIMQDDRNEAAQISALLASKRIFLNAKGMLAAVTNPAVRPLPSASLHAVPACLYHASHSRHVALRVPSAN